MAVTGKAMVRSDPVPRRLLPGEVAWIALIPVAIATVAAVALLGPPLARFAFGPSAGGTAVFWNWALPVVRPEPTEHARYVLALLGPLALAGAVAALAGRAVSLGTRAITLIASCGQAALLGALAVAIVAQLRHVYELPYAETPFRRVYFTPSTLAVAVVVAGLLAVAFGRVRRSDRVANWVRDTSPRRWGAFVLALGFTALWVLTAVNTEASLSHEPAAITDNMPFWLDETYAVLDGRTPLATFHAQYANLWPYVSAGAMTLFGASFGVYSTTMAAASCAALMAVYALLRRVVRSSVIALLLFGPFVAHGFFLERGPLSIRYGPSTSLSMFPMRYAGPYLLAWLTARHIDGARPRRLLPLIAAGALVAVDNAEFGLPALAATLAAILWAGPRSRARIGRMLAETAGGVLASAALVTSLTWISSGSLPRPGLLVEFSRIYGTDGFGMLPMSTVGMHLALYLTFAVTIVVATVRAVSGAEQRLLTGMLAWSGVFGLGAGAYFAGRSHPEVLIDLFSAWALALVLLVVVVARAIAAREPRMPAPAELAVLLGFGVAVCSLAQTPLPWSEVERLRVHAQGPPPSSVAVERFMAAYVRPGERVMIQANYGHRIAYHLKVTDVLPYANALSMPERQQLDAAIRVARREGARNLFYEFSQMSQEQRRYLIAQGYRFVRRSVKVGVEQLVDTR